MEGQECVGTAAEAFLFVGVTSQLFRKLHSRQPNPRVGSARQKKRGMGASSSLFRSSSRVKFKDQLKQMQGS